MSTRDGIAPYQGSGGLTVRSSTGKVFRKFQSALADIVFVIDTTGSMNDKIQGLLTTCHRFVDEIAKRRINWRIALIGFGDLTVEGDTIQATGFSNRIDTVNRWIRDIPRNYGGGNDGESSLDALDRALSFKNYREGAIKVFVFMTDEPALTNRFTPEQITQRLKQSGTIVFVISDPISYYQKIASETGGRWFQIQSDTDFLSILDELFKQISETVEEVQALAGGDVEEYLRLKSGR